MNTKRMTNITDTNKFIYLVLFCSIAAGYFAVTDLQISILLVNKNAEWAIFLEKFGEIPGLLVLLSGIYIYLSHSFSLNSAKSTATTAVLFLAVLFLSGYFFVVLDRGLLGGYELLLENILLFITVILLLNIIIVNRLRKINFTERVINFGKVTILLGLYGYLFLVQPLKILWGRVRFRDLNSIYSNFSDWFVIKGITGNESFPSGHSAMGWMILPVLILFSKNKIGQRILLIIISVWAVAVGISRIVIGAHFASDVLFGAFFVIMVYLLLKNRYLQDY